MGGDKTTIEQVSLTNDILFWNDHVLKEDLCRIRGMISQLLDLVGGDTVGLKGDTDERFILVGRTVTGVGEHTHPVSLGAVCNPHLAAIDD